MALFVGTEYIPILMQLTAGLLILEMRNEWIVLSDRMMSFQNDQMRNGHDFSGVRAKKKIIWLASEAWDRNNGGYLRWNLANLSLNLAF